jgi:aspartate ammonia-lyase
MRKERDSLGEISVPEEAYYGIQTERARRNFPISGLRLHPAMLEAMILIKKAAALVNTRQGRLSERQGAAIAGACDEILQGNLRDQFVVDVFQMGAGTSFHMNCNEVLANRAEEILGGVKGRYRLVHPNDHVNLGQSTNDTFPTAMRLAIMSLLERDLLKTLKDIEKSFAAKGREFGRILKSGRTHLQDAAPLRLGQEFHAYAEALKKGRRHLERAARPLLELGIGGSAVGTGLNTSPGYREDMVKTLADMTGFSLKKSADPREAMQSMQPFTLVSAALRGLAVEMTRIANDLRLLSSGPRTGLSEISLPPVAPGSSIMPGKVNPSLPEMMNMVCFQIQGCDQAVCLAAQAGQLELNVMMPLIAHNLCFMIEIFASALRQLDRLCIRGIKADRERCLAYAKKSMGLATALSPFLGYDSAAEASKEALRSGRPLPEVILEKGLLSAKELEKILDPFQMTEPGRPPAVRKDKGNPKKPD